MNHQSRNISVVVSGSFRKHFAVVGQCLEVFHLLGVPVLSPMSSNIRGFSNDFAILETDDTDDVESLESRHLSSILRASALYVCNPEGYVGISTSLEIGWALASKKRIFAQEYINDSTLRSFCGDIGGNSPITIASPEQAVTQLEASSHEFEDPVIIDHNTPLDGLQRYVAQVSMNRGFHEETSVDILILMTEEMGELARQVRKHSGIKTDLLRQNSRNKLGHELADLLFYVLHFSNTERLNLLDEFLEIEAKNQIRRWG